jgi:hypothetical protein
MRLTKLVILDVMADWRGCRESDEPLVGKSLLSLLLPIAKFGYDFPKTEGPTISSNIRASPDRQVSPTKLPSSSYNGVLFTTTENRSPDLCLTGNFPLQHFPLNIFRMISCAGLKSAGSQINSRRSWPIASDAQYPYRCSANRFLRYRKNGRI